MAFLNKDLNKYINIFYETKKQESPQAPWITLINGHMRTTKDFVFLSRKFFENGFSVLTFDSRGSGQTTCETNFSLDDIKNDCLDLWNELHIEKSHLIGFSMGGLIAQMIAQTNPERIDHLIFISTCFRRKDLHVSSEVWPEDLQGIKDRLCEYFSKKFQEKNDLLVEAMAKSFLKEIKENRFNERAKQQRQAIDVFQEGDFDTCLLPAVSILHGKLDLIASVETVDFGLKRYPRGRVHWYENSGHLLLAEEGTRLAGDIVEILKG